MSELVKVRCSCGEYFVPPENRPDWDRCMECTLNSPAALAAEKRKKMLERRRKSYWR